jgi:hypothetical protein
MAASGQVTADPLVLIVEDDFSTRAMYREYLNQPRGSAP